MLAPQARSDVPSPPIDQLASTHTGFPYVPCPSAPCPGRPDLFRPTGSGDTARVAVCPETSGNFALWAVAKAAMVQLGRASFMQFWWPLCALLPPAPLTGLLHHRLLSPRPAPPCPCLPLPPATGRRPWCGVVAEPAGGLARPARAWPGPGLPFHLSHFISSDNSNLWILMPGGGTRSGSLGISADCSHQLGWTCHTQPGGSGDFRVGFGGWGGG